MANAALKLITAPAYVLLAGKTLDDLGPEWVAEDGQVYVVMTMRAEDFRQLMPLFKDVTISVVAR